jgi:hypothetical protein
VRGLKIQLAIAAAPFIEALAKGFTDLIQSAGGVKEIVASLTETVGNFIAVLLDGLQQIVAELAGMGDKPGAGLKGHGGGARIDRHEVSSLQLRSGVNHPFVAVADGQEIRAEQLRLEQRVGQVHLRNEMHVEGGLAARADDGD